jgi:hypothetical protein
VTEEGNLYMDGSKGLGNGDLPGRKKGGRKMEKKADTGRKAHE